MTPTFVAPAAWRCRTGRGPARRAAAPAAPARRISDEVVAEAPLVLDVPAEGRHALVGEVLRRPEHGVDTGAMAKTSSCSTRRPASSRSWAAVSVSSLADADELDRSTVQTPPPCSFDVVDVGTEAGLAASELLAEGSAEGDEPTDPDGRVADPGNVEPVAEPAAVAAAPSPEVVPTSCSGVVVARVAAAGEHERHQRQPRDAEPAGPEPPSECRHVSPWCVEPVS